METKNLLDDLRDGFYPLTRKEAVDGLGKLEASDEDLVLELFIAKEFDKDDTVKEAAGKALENPAHKALLEKMLAENPALREKGAATLQARAETKKKESEAAKTKVQTKGGIGGWGIWLVIAGVIALILPSFGYNLLLFHIIPITSPFAAIVVIIIGVALIVANSASKKR